VRRGGGGELAVSGGMLPLERNLEQFPELHPAFDSQSALAEANRCLFCFDAPCMGACPTHIDVPRFIKKIGSGNLRGSALAILNANILGLSCPSKSDGCSATPWTRSMPEAPACQYRNRGLRGGAWRVWAAVRHP
jgi:hypothetical protein